MAKERVMDKGQHLIVRIRVKIQRYGEMGRGFDSVLEGDWAWIKKGRGDCPGRHMRWPAQDLSGDPQRPEEDIASAKGERQNRTTEKE